MQSSHLSIDLETLDYNIDCIRDALDPSVRMMAVIKSDAYSHGAAVVAPRAEARGVSWFAVAYLREALEVRRAVSNADILILGPVEPDDVATLAAERITPVVVGAGHAARLGAAAREAGVELSVHIKVDTGMGRLGVYGVDSADQILAVIREPGIKVSGICSHFASVEPSRPQLALDQLARFHEAVEVAEREVGGRLLRHISSSRALQFFKEWDLDLVRPGIILYGYGSGEANMRCATRPLLEWKTGVLQVKDVPEDTGVGYYSSYRTMQETDIGTIAVGYADGYLRSLSNRGAALVGGQRCPVVGRISMNWVTLELGPGSGVEPGDEVVLLGRQGDEQVWADEMSRAAGTIAYEILTAIHPATPRIYRG